MTSLPGKCLFAVELPGEPKGKGRPRFSTKTGHAYTPEATRSFESDLRGMALVAMGARPLAEGPVAAIVTATFGVPRSWSQKKAAKALSGEIRPTKKPDADNILKMLDALNHVVFRDDSQITDATIVKRYGERPSLKVIVTEATR